jgi:hypothetical protein
VLYEEGEGKAKKVKVRGHFGNYDVATANKRLYPKTLWEREITRHQKAMTERQMFGELDHPSDGRTMLNRVAHRHEAVAGRRQGLWRGRDSRHRSGPQPAGTPEGRLQGRR